MSRSKISSSFSVIRTMPFETLIIDIKLITVLQLFTIDVSIDLKNEVIKFVNA